jgi:hypothetical protein
MQLWLQDLVHLSANTTAVSKVGEVRLKPATTAVVQVRLKPDTTSNDLSG